MHVTQLSIFKKNILEDINSNFLATLLPELPYKNIYYLVCFVEVINNLLEQNKVYYSKNKMLTEVINKANKYYLSINISDVFYKS